MNRKIRFVSIAIAVLISVCALAVTASAVVPTDYSAYGQVKLEGYLGGDLPTVDGVFGENEYKNVFEQAKGTAGFSHSSEASEAIITSVKFGITVTDDAIYLGVVVTEPNYKFRVGSTAGSYMAFSFGFDLGDKFYNCMTRQTMTLSITDQAALFKANTVLTYGADGKYNGTNTPKYAGNVYDAADGKRNDDGTTVYECKLNKEKLVAAQKAFDSTGTEIADGNPIAATGIGNTFYVHYEAIGYDAAGTKGTAVFRDILSTEAKNTIKDQDGWVATFAPHILVLTEEQTQTGGGEGGQGTGGEGGEPNPQTGDPLAIFSIVAAVSAAVPAVIAVRRRKH